MTTVASQQEHPTALPPAAESSPDRLDEKTQRANYLYHVVEGGCYMGGSSFVAPNCVLPRIVQLLGAPSWVISLTPALTMLGFSGLPIFTAHRVETLGRVRPMLVPAGAIQRSPFLLAGLLLLFCHGPNLQWVPLVAVLSAPLLSGAVGGLTSTAWQELVVKTVPNRKRSSLFAWRYTLSSLIGITAGGVIAAVLARVPGIPGYGILYLISFFFVALSFLLFVRIKEPAHEQRRAVAGSTLAQNLRQVLDILRADRRLRSYVTVTFLTNATLIMVPFLPIHILHTTGRPDSFLGLLVTAQMLGGISGNLLSGFGGDRYGGKALMVAGRVLMALSCATAGFLSSAWAFAALFFVQGTAGAAIMVGAQTMNIELCPYDKRSTYLAVMAAVNVPAVFFFSFVGGQLWDMKTGFNALSLLAALVLVVSIPVLLKIPEPRKRGALSDLVVHGAE